LVNVGRNYNGPKVSGLSSDESGRTRTVVNEIDKYKLPHCVVIHRGPKIHGHMLEAVATVISREDPKRIRRKPSDTKRHAPKSRLRSGEDMVQRKIGSAQRNSLSGKFRRARMA